MLLRDIRRYAKALWRQSVPLLTGGGLMALLAIYGLSTGATLPQNIAWLVLGLTFIAASFLAWRKEEAEKDALMNEKDAALKLQVERDNRIFLSSQPNQLLPRAGTAVQRKFQSSVYLGKWIRVDVKVQDVSEKYTGKVEVLAKLTDGTVCYLGFDREWRERIIVLHQGDPLFASGKIEILSNFLGLTDCELHNPKPINPESPTPDPQSPLPSQG